ncbi:hypothetical protein ACFWBN_17075 [Streptomyces sp. NPDC059989]|uniref:hypothetical protein n=1 Tax=Streptomyces sp. NPDC059989 TaxID=3347026 RepID=UPI003696FC4D
MSGADPGTRRAGRRRFDAVHLWSTTVTGTVALGIALFKGTLTLHRAGGSDPIVESFCLDISAQALESFRQGGQRTYYEFRNDRPVSRTKKDPPCYAY